MFRIVKYANVALINHVLFRQQSSILKKTVKSGMNLASGKTLHKVFAVALELVRKKVIVNIEDGDVALGQLKSHLETEFDEVNRKLDKIIDSPMKTAHINMKKGLIELHCKDLVGAKRYFENCEDDCEKAFAQSKTFMDKIAVTRLKIMCILYLNNYFSGECNMEKVHLHCKDSIERLLSEPEVRSALRDQYEGSIMSFLSSSSRRVIFDELASLIYFIKSNISIEPTLRLQSGKTIELRNIPITKWKAHGNYLVEVLLVNDNKIYSASNDKTIKSWDFTSFSEIKTLSGHTHWIECMTISNGRLYSGCFDKNIKIWDLTTNKELTNLACQYRVSTLAVWKDKLFHNEDSSKIKVWDLTTLKQISLLESHEDWIICLFVSGNKLYSGSFDNTIKVWDLTTMKEVATLVGHSNRVNCLTVSDGKLYSGSHDKTIKVWDLESFEEIATLPCEHIVSSVTVCGNFVYWNTYYGALGVIDTASMSNTIIYDKSHEVTSFTISGGKLIAGCKDGIYCSYL